MALPNNSFNPTARNVPLINLASCDAGCVVAAGGGLIRALDTLREAEGPGLVQRGPAK